MKIELDKGHRIVYFDFTEMLESIMSDTDEDENVCAICWEAFTQPKFLRCRHTFCKSCLKGYLKKTENSTEIKCPICRGTQKLNKEGLDGLLDNYFAHRRLPDQPELLCCSVCFEEAILKTCLHCLEKHCPTCRQSHKLALKIAGESCEYDADSESDDDTPVDFDDKDLTDEPNVPFSVLMSGQVVQTQINVKLISAFKVKSMENSAEEDQNPPIYTIFPKGDNRFLIIINVGPEIVEYEPDGTEINRLTFSGSISDMRETANNRILFVHPKDPFVLEINGQNRITIFAQCKGCRPITLAPFQDGRIAVAGFVIPVEEKEEKEGEKAAMLIIYDKAGKMIRELTEGPDGPILRFPMGISVSSFNNNICVADQDSRCAIITDENCNLIKRYDAGRTFREFRFLWNPTEFAPIAVCNDPDGNFIVANTADGLLHVLDPNGTFLGYILTKDAEGFGHPAGIMMDDKNRIWLGDRLDGKIRIYEISSYKNSFDVRDSEQSPYHRFLQNR